MGRQINHHILVNLNGIRTLSDLVGGVEVDVPKRLYYRDRSQGLLIDLQPGPQVLQGEDLEGFPALAPRTRRVIWGAWLASNSC